MGSGRTRAGNCGKLSDTSRARAYILGPCRALGDIPPYYVKRFECLEKHYINVTN